MEYLETIISYAAELFGEIDLGSITELFSDIDWSSVLSYLTTIYETIAGLLG